MRYSMPLMALVAVLGWWSGGEAAPVPLDATVTRSGALVSVSRVDGRHLRVHVGADGATVVHELDLDTLPPGAQVESLRAGAFGPDGVALGLAVREGEVTSYRWMFVADARRAAGPAADAASRDGWVLSQPVFASTGEPYRIVDVHNAGGDTLELTFRRGAMSGVRHPDGEPAVDELVFQDVCPMADTPRMQGRTRLAAVAGLREAE